MQQRKLLSMREKKKEEKRVESGGKKKISSDDSLCMFLYEWVHKHNLKEVQRKYVRKADRLSIIQPVLH